jgi:hypothetical protein
MTYVGVEQQSDSRGEALMADQITNVEAEFTLFKQPFSGLKKRLAQRYRCPLATLGRLSFADGTAEEAWAHNISESGIGLNLTHPLEAGTNVLVRLRGSSRNGAVALPARVVHATQELDGSWRVGCAFESKLQPEVLDALL